MVPIVRAVLLASLIVGGSDLVLTAGGSASAHTVATSTPPLGAGSTMYNRRYCEILLVTGVLTSIKATVYSTIGESDCPQAQWQALSPSKLKKEFHAESIEMNGPRYFMMDNISYVGQPGKVVSFDGLLMRQLATVDLPLGSLLKGATSTSYTENTVVRTTTYTYNAGRLIYLLTSPSGHTYILQSYALIVDPTLEESDLTTLGQRLKLPAGWHYQVHRLSRTFDLKTVGGKAAVLQDNLDDSYQRIDGPTTVR